MARVTCPNCEAKECGATFRITQSFDHFLNPPVKSTQELAVALIKNLPREQQLELIGL